MRKLSFILIFFSLVSFPSFGKNEESIRVATFNIQVFGQTKASNPEIMEELARIVRQYDIVAIQEIKDVKEKVPYLFLAKVNEKNNEYRLILSPRTGLQEDDKKSQEQYAFIYNSKKIEQVGQGKLFDDTKNDLFQREPFSARFRIIGTKESFVLINVHVSPKLAKLEIESLHSVFWWNLFEYSGEENFVVLGDFNADCDYISEEGLNMMPMRNEEFTWIVPDTEDTTVSATDCAYDRIVMTSNMNKKLYNGMWGVDRSFENKEVSDHFPVWFELKVKSQGKKREELND